MKVALINDTHFGIRSGNDAFHKSNQRFYSEVFFPALNQRGISNIWHGGDIYDKQSGVDTISATKAKEYFFDPMRSQGIEMVGIIGNHDIPLKNTNMINSPRALLGEYENVYIIDTEPYFNPDYNVLFLPWITKDNAEVSYDYVKKSGKSTLVLAHLELKGFDMHKGSPNLEGMDPAIFGKVRQVYTGHFHTPSQKGNIRYLGAAGQHRWSDVDDWRGFHIYDTEIGDIVESIENPFIMFETLYIKGDKEAEKFIISEPEGKFLKVEFRDITKPNLIKKIQGSLEDAGAVDVKIHEVIEKVDMILEEGSSVDTMSLFFKIITEDADLRPGQLEKVMAGISSLYNEAIKITDAR